MWMMSAMVASTALGAFGQANAQSRQAMMEKFQYEQKALQAQHEANTANINAQITAFERGTTMAALQNEALMQGLKDGQEMAKTKVQQSTSGVLMNSASKHMQRASERFIHIINKNNMEMNRVTTLGNLEIKKTNYLGEAIVKQAESEANKMLAASISPKKAGFMGFLMGGAQGVTTMLGMAGMAGGGANGG